MAGVLRGAQTILWVEPGSKLTSRRLSGVRDALLGEFDVLAPCTHRAQCGILGPGHERDWCHFFARPPAEVHTTARWRQISDALGIDLRSLPYAFLCLTKSTADSQRTSTEPRRRVLGRPRVQRGRVLLDLCGPVGVETSQFLQREHKDIYKALKKDATTLRFEPPS